MSRQNAEVVIMEDFSNKVFNLKELLDKFVKKVDRLVTKVAIFIMVQLFSIYFSYSILEYVVDQIEFPQQMDPLLIHFLYCSLFIIIQYVLIQILSYIIKKFHFRLFFYKLDENDLKALNHIWIIISTMIFIIIIGIKDSFFDYVWHMYLCEYTKRYSDDIETSRLLMKALCNLYIYTIQVVTLSLFYGVRQLKEDFKISNQIIDDAFSPYEEKPEYTKYDE